MARLIAFGLTVVLCIGAMPALCPVVRANDNAVLYSMRAHTSTIKAGGDLNIADTQMVMMRSIINYVIQMRGFYHGRQRVYLARDGEYFHDVDWMLWHLSKNPGDPEPLLVNASRKAIMSEHLWDYLNEQGLTARPFIFIDSGFDGTIIKNIGKMFQQHGITVPLGHLISSANARYPSSRFSTLPFVRDDEGRSFDQPLEKERFLDLVDQQVYGIEKLPHETTSSAGFTKDTNGHWQPFSTEAQDANVVAAAKQFRGQLLRLAQSVEVQERSRAIEGLLIDVVETFNAGVVDPELIKAFDRQFVTERLDFMWRDMREAIIKGTLLVDSSTYQTLIKTLSPHAIDFFDLEPDELTRFNQKEREFLETRPQDTHPRLLSPIEQILAFHAKQEVLVEINQQVFDDIKTQIRTGRLQVAGQVVEIDHLLDEGYRAEVYLLKDGRILKVAHEADDMRYMLVEEGVNQLLKKHYDTFHISVPSLHFVHPTGAFLIRDDVGKASIGRRIRKAEGLSSVQRDRLEHLFEAAKAFAEATGIGLDIKDDNIAWQNGDWVVFDAGPRTSYGPYAFSLDIENFATFYKLWSKDLPRQNGRSIAEQIARIQAKGLTRCSGSFLRD